MSDDDTKHDAETTAEVGYRKPPREHRFKPGSSGNKRGRPKGATDLKASAKRALTEKLRADPNGTGKSKSYMTLELLLIKLKQSAALGNRPALKALVNLENQYRPSAPATGGYLVIPERLTEAEWEAKYTPKEDLLLAKGEIDDEKDPRLG